MHHSDLYEVLIVLLGFVAVPIAGLMAIIGVVTRSSLAPKAALVFAALLGGAGLLSVGLGALGYAMVAGYRSGSSQHSVLALGVGAAMVPLFTACLLVGRAFFEKRSWPTLGGAFAVALGTQLALGGLVIQQVARSAYNSDLASGSGAIVTGLLAGLPIALLGLVQLVRTSRPVSG